MKLHHRLHLAAAAPEQVSTGGILHQMISQGEGPQTWPHRAPWHSHIKGPEAKYRTQVGTGAKGPLAQGLLPQAMGPEPKGTWAQGACAQAMGPAPKTHAPRK